MMLDKETIHAAFDNLVSQGWRSSFTIIGIVLGITAIIVLVSLGEGLTQSVNQQFEGLGTVTLTVLPGKSFADMGFMKLQSSDVEKIEGVRGVEFAAEVFIQTQQLEFKSEKKTLVVLGIDPDKMQQLGGSGIASIAEGRQLSSKDKTGIVVGPKLAEKQFQRRIHVNSGILIGGKHFNVIGINGKSSNSFMGGFFDNAVLMNSSSLEELVGTTLSPNRIMVELLPGSNPSEVQERVQAVLKRSHGKEDFQVLTTKQAAQTSQDVLGIIQLVLVGIAAISLLVGAVGVTNTMFMSVTERTKEIGTMKAIGATNNQVLSIFIVEALLIGLAGGVIGTILGIGISALISVAATVAGFELQAITSITTILFAVGFSMLIGLIAGFWPAKTAADLDPIEALRQGE